MPLIKTEFANQPNKAISEDTWHQHVDGETLKDNLNIVSLAYWLEHKASLASCDSTLGLKVDGHEDVNNFSADLSRFALISIYFAAFTDGRGYSLAKTLREKFNYMGEIRAIGDILPDQALYLSRVGFDTLEIADDKLATIAITKLSEYTVFYQPKAL